MVLALCGAACIVLLVLPDHRVRAVAILAAFAGLLVAPSIWAIDTLGYETQPTFPAGGPESQNPFVASIVRPGGVSGPGGGAPGGRAAPLRAALGPACLALDLRVRREAPAGRGARALRSSVRVAARPRRPAPAPTATCAR